MHLLSRVPLFMSRMLRSVFSILFYQAFSQRTMNVDLTLLKDDVPGYRIYRSHSNLRNAQGLGFRVPRS